MNDGVVKKNKKRVFQKGTLYKKKSEVKELQKENVTSN